MTAELLREAAAKMRERAEAATSGPWVPHVRSVQPEATHPHVGWISTPGNRLTVAENAWDGDVLHIASWHPAVALAVALLLKNEANAMDLADRYIADGLGAGNNYNHARRSLLEAIASAYLGRDA